MSAIFLVLLFSTSVVGVIFFYRGLPGSSKDIGWKMSGVWSNPNNLHVLLHNNGPFMRGHVVLSESDYDSKSDSSLVIKEVAVKPLWQWSTGTFVEPGSRKEHPVMMRLSGLRTISVKFLNKNKIERWKLIDPL